MADGLSHCFERSSRVCAAAGSIPAAFARSWRCWASAGPTRWKRVALHGAGRFNSCRLRFELEKTRIAGGRTRLLTVPPARALWGQHPPSPLRHGIAPRFLPHHRRFSSNLPLSNALTLQLVLRAWRTSERGGPQNRYWWGRHPPRACPEGGVAPATPSRGTPADVVQQQDFRPVSGRRGCNSLHRLLASPQCSRDSPPLFPTLPSRIGPGL